MCQEEKMTPQYTNKMFGNRRAVSPILATVLLLGITVVGGGLAYSLMAQGSNTASSQNIITLENAQAVKGTSHSDLTATIKNGGSIPWKKVEMTVAKSELSEPLLYEALHENVQGCVDKTSNANPPPGISCNDANAKPAKNLDNPLRSQWIAHLDITGGTSGVADKGEGISAGRKFVISTADPEIRTTVVNKDTSVYKLMIGDSTESSKTNISTTSLGCASTTANDFTLDCTDFFKELDPISGKVFCKRETTTSNIECKIATHRQISAPIQPGQSVQIYADAFTKSVPGLGNLFVQNGDGLVVNIVAEGENGSTARYQTIIKVTGI
jgi:flagellin-like protein